MDDYQSLSHTVWDCKYHVVWIPKCRQKILYAEFRKHLGQVFKMLALQKESKILEGHLMVDHVHMLISIPPKYGVSQVVGFIKGKSAIHIARVFHGRKRDFTGHNFWAKGYSCQQLPEARRSFGNTSKNKSPKTNALTNCKCSKGCHLSGGHWFTTALSNPVRIAWTTSTIFHAARGLCSPKSPVLFLVLSVPRHGQRRQLLD